MLRHPRTRESRRTSWDMWEDLTYIPEAAEDVDDSELLWFDSEIKPEDVLEATDHPSHYEFTVDGKKRRKPGSKHTTVGKKCVVNGTPVAIFKHKSTLYAINDVCPHQGGSLHLGDIEDIGGDVCVACPRHHWPFSLTTGTCTVIAKFKAQRYRVQIRSGGHGHDTIFIGFESLSSNLFTADDFNFSRHFSFILSFGSLEHTPHDSLHIGVLLASSTGQSVTNNGREADEAASTRTGARPDGAA
ncbi:hypothetical protein PINS_up001669 [Pythium insidiosum]|nr:hypothetical protein PINS_up001669 [Pythium insidiosum]